MGHCSSSGAHGDAPDSSLRWSFAKVSPFSSTFGGGARLRALDRPHRVLLRGESMAYFISDVEGYHIVMDTEIFTFRWRSPSLYWEDRL